MTIELDGDGSPVALWRGSLEALRQRRDATAAQGRTLAGVMAGLGALAALAGFFCLRRAFAAE